MSLPGEAPRYGVTIPFDDLALADHPRRLRELAELGYTDAWTPEANGSDAFTPLALAAAWEPRLRLGTAIVSVFTRGPAVLAQTAAALADVAPERFSLGVGTGTGVTVTDWNGIAFEEPFKRARDTIRFLRVALAGERVEADFETFDVSGFRLARPPATPPPILLAALRPGMLRLAAREADGAILNWLSAEDVKTIVAEVGIGTRLVARCLVCPSEDATVVRHEARRLIAAYLNVEAYRKFHEWLGRGELLAAMWSAWAEGDRAGALEAIPDSVIDDLIVHGSAEACREHLRRYADNGVDTVVSFVLPWGGVEIGDALHALAPGQA